ncbi:MAG TPA: hypothetical protein VGY98_19015 [Verrucomicrobiae bacterium]|nr:hypothetical protein [Verrucomicrobiae bacterium]
MNITNIGTIQTLPLTTTTGNHSTAATGAKNSSGPVDSDGDHDGSLPGVPDAGDGKLNVTA